MNKQKDDISVLQVGSSVSFDFVFLANFDPLVLESLTHFLEVEDQTIERYQPEYSFELPTDVKAFFYPWGFFLGDGLVKLFQFRDVLEVIFDENDHGLLDHAFELTDELSFFRVADAKVGALLG